MGSTPVSLGLLGPAPLRLLRENSAPLLADVLSNAVLWPRKISHGIVRADATLDLGCSSFLFLFCVFLWVFLPWLISRKTYIRTLCENTLLFFFSLKKLFLCRCWLWYIAADWKAADCRKKYCNFELQCFYLHVDFLNAKMERRVRWPKLRRCWGLTKDFQPHKTWIIWTLLHLPLSPEPVPFFCRPFHWTGEGHQTVLHC